MLGTISFALLWFVLGAVAMFIFSSWCWRKLSDEYGKDELTKDIADTNDEIADFLFPKK